MKMHLGEKSHLKILMTMKVQFPTMTHILMRIRDKDPNIRKNVFLKLLKDKTLLKNFL